MSKIFLTIFFVLIHVGLNAQKSTSFKTELRYLCDISKLPAYKTNTIVSQQSTYDTTGGNNDGFRGNFSFVRRNADSSLVMLDVVGPGVIERIWTPTPTTDTLDFFIDDMAKPALSICYTDLFSGKAFPFVRPICNSAAGGYYCYFPILFQHRCMIVCRGHKLQFHQIQYRLFPVGTKINSFSKMVNKEEKDLLQDIAARWKEPARPKSESTSSNFHFQIAPKKTTNIFSYSRGGRINGIELDGLDLSRLWIRAYWDMGSIPAIDCPLDLFFGHAFGNPSMKSLLVGTDSTTNYCYFPMPFDRSARIEIVNRSNDLRTISGKILFSKKKRDLAHEGKFYAHYAEEDLTENDPYHIFLNVQGKGHYVGSILVAEGKQKGWTPFFEGDDSTAIDGVFRIHGTGSEDYFNGGWYDIKGRWDTTRSLPISGCLLYDRALARTGGYRFYLSDKLSFEKSIYQCIEHGETVRGRPAHYASIAFYYADKNR